MCSAGQPEGDIRSWKIWLARRWSLSIASVAQGRAFFWITTWVLLGIPAEAISGYTQEEYTHLGVTAAVRSGRADCGLAIAAAAKALELDFIPLFQERYDLIVPEEHFPERTAVPCVGGAGKSGISPGSI